MFSLTSFVWDGVGESSFSGTMAEEEVQLGAFFCLSELAGFHTSIWFTGSLFVKLNDWDLVKNNMLNWSLHWTPPFFFLVSNTPIRSFNIDKIKIFLNYVVKPPTFTEVREETSSPIKAKTVEVNYSSLDILVDDE